MSLNQKLIGPVGLREIKSPKKHKEEIERFVTAAETYKFKYSLKSENSKVQRNISHENILQFLGMYDPRQEFELKDVNYY